MRWRPRRAAKCTPRLGGPAPGRGVGGARPAGRRRNRDLGRRRPARLAGLALAAALERRIPVAVSMAGGYGTVIEDTVGLQVTTLRLAFTHWQAWQSLHPRAPDRRVEVA